MFSSFHLTIIPILIPIGLSLTPSAETIHLSISKATSVNAMLLEIIILGIIQGFIEWLPISSQGNLVLFMVSFLGINEAEALSISVYLHTGTLISALIYFRKTFWNLLKAMPKYRFRTLDKRENRLITFLILSTLFTGIVGYPVFRLARTATGFGNLFFMLIGAALIFTGIVQRKAGNLGNLGTRSIDDITVTDGLLLGIVQGLSAFPGMSRSGITISFLLFRRFDPESSLKISFLMSVPAVLAAEIGLNAMKGLPALGSVEVILGCLVSFIVGIISIDLLLRIARKVNMWILCLVLGLITVISAI